MKIIVGLGNPGSKYSWTRHNLGFMLIDALAPENLFQSKHKSQIQKREWQSERLLLVKPQTFMNLSGQAVKEIMNFYKSSLEDLLVIQDDKDLPFGKMKFQKARGDGGHNGIKNIHQELNSNQYSRLKMGIGIEQSTPENNLKEKADLSSSEEKEKHNVQESLIWPTLKTLSEKFKKNKADYVLSPFNKKEREKLPSFLEKGVKAVFYFTEKGYEASANQFNSL